ncbi:MAG: single-stranded-DNA-specific exonuclease RecJ [Desulfamplus sp.]|nr:single-stranded-DNA-specific exonuclease RecJ [Desulfamplus sp.]
MQAEWLNAVPDPEVTAKISRITGCHEIVAALLVNRGITTPEQAFTFLNPSLQHLTDPFILKDMNKSVERIYTAVCNKEKILIFGDFDADGITATVMLNDFLSYVEADVSWYIPHRIREGYSLKQAHIDMAVKQNIDLLITVDCGSDSHEAVRAAIREDIDVIITDHHEITRFRPPAFAVVNPKQKDCKSDLDHLAGVGVAFYVVVALRQYFRQKGFWEDIAEPNLMEYLDLFAIGTIADMVPLKTENRILSRAGIEIIRQGKREGLKALVKESKIDQNHIDSDDISFKIAPRINAAGRISHSRICVDLLTEKNKVKAEQTAFILSELNKKRQELEKSIVDEIEKAIKLDPEIINNSSIVMDSANWNAGVLGIVASKVAKKYCCPVVLISTAATPSVGLRGHASSTVATGSCRSIGNINIHDALYACSDLLENFGGHMMAAGISIKTENIKKFSDRFRNQILKVTTPEDFIPKIAIDLHIDINHITEQLANEIDGLRPFGTDNPEPIFECSDIKVISSFTIGLKHRKMVLQQMDGNKKNNISENFQNSSDGNNSIEYRTIEAMQFNIGQEDAASVPDYFEKIAVKIKMNRFNGKNRPTIIIEKVADRKQSIPVFNQRIPDGNSGDDQYQNALENLDNY